MSTLHELTDETLDRLGDLANDVWSRAEIELYLQDAYDTFCRSTAILYDQFVIENLPKVGNWQTDLERYLAEQKPGWGLTDEPFHFTGEHERNLGTGGRYGGTYRGPAPATSPSERTYFDTDNFNATTSDLPSLVPGGEVPPETIEVLRVTYDNLTLQGISSAQMRRIDSQYESRQGDPRWYIWDKDGLFYVRVVPAAGGDATYDTVSGSWGTLRYTDDTDVSVITASPDGRGTGGFGILRHRTDTFPSGGPWGTPRRIHPASKGIKVEVYRLGRNLRHHASELPSAFEKYVVYGAAAQALRREGSGQSLELAQHYDERFETGVKRLSRKKREMDKERAATLGGRSGETAFPLGDPQAPYNYGLPR